MSAIHQQEYWEDRGGVSFSYRGECLYTITAAPYYLARRALIEAKISEELLAACPKMILDFGCGDGAYIKKLRDTYNRGVGWVGLDPSSSMLARARKLCPDANFVDSIASLAGVKTFDFAYAVAVMAHVENEKLPGLLQELGELLRIGGRLIMVEQVASLERRGVNHIRRTVDRYAEVFVSLGFEVDSIQIIDWPLHRYFERFIAKGFYRFFCGRGSEHERRVSANRNPLFLSLSRLCLSFSRAGLLDYTRPCWGYAVFSCRKVSC